MFSGVLSRIVFEVRILIRLNEFSCFCFFSHHISTLGMGSLSKDSFWVLSPEIPHSLVGHLLQVKIQFRTFWWKSGLLSDFRNFYRFTFLIVTGIIGHWHINLLNFLLLNTICILLLEIQKEISILPIGDNYLLINRVFVFVVADLVSLN